MPAIQSSAIFGLFDIVWCRCTLKKLFGGECSIDLVTQNEALKLTEQAIALACSKLGDKRQVR